LSTWLDMVRRFSITLPGGLEGIVSKRIDLPYCSGRTWLKTKNKDYSAIQRGRHSTERANRLGVIDGREL
jgi:ATP-dependent DNA ligase